TGRCRRRTPPVRMAVLILSRFIRPKSIELQGVPAKWKHFVGNDSALEGSVKAAEAYIEQHKGLLK
ncbi:MAG: hypothetical protein IIY00_06425, partial [Clostridia bacterium]|nr:hypothetical protein [Clostridia bacterium]